MNKLTEVQKQKIKEIVGKIYRDGIAENMTRQDIRINELYELFFSLLQKEREAGKREGYELGMRDGIIKAHENADAWRDLSIDIYKKLKSVEKSNSLQEKLEIDDFKFDKKGNSIP